MKVDIKLLFISPPLPLHWLRLRRTEEKKFFFSNDRFAESDCQIFLSCFKFFFCTISGVNLPLMIKFTILACTAADIKFLNVFTSGLKIVKLAFFKAQEPPRAFLEWQG
jgi:hypothetical protein